MPTITVVTFINAPVEKVFDLSRSIDLHRQSMAHTNEKAVDGRMTGLITLGETVTWQARHFFKTRKLTTRITAMQPCTYFRDEMIAGDFALMQHDHYFQPTNAGTTMKDVFVYRLPYGWLGKLVDLLVMKRYLRKLLLQRNAVIRQEAEKQ